MWLPELYRWRDRTSHLHLTFAISGSASGKRCCGHICVGEALRRVYCESSHVAITAHGKGRLCIAMSLLMFLVAFLSQTPANESVLSNISKCNLLFPPFNTNYVLISSFTKIVKDNIKFSSQFRLEANNQTHESENQYKRNTRQPF